MITNRAIQCPNCGQPLSAAVETLINVSADPDAKVRLLSGRTNTVRCSGCGVSSTIAAPILYHDGAKELLISYVPMELGLPKEQQERAIGDLMRELTSQIPKDQIRGYLFQPRQALTLQSLTDQILEADGVTPEMMEAQRSRVRLVETLLQAPPDQMPQLIQQHDAEIDSQFFQAIVVMAQRMVQENQPELAERLLMLQQDVLQYSSLGQEMLQQNAVQEQIVREVAEAIEELGDDAGRGDLLDMAISYAGDDDRLQALVGLVRPALDYAFFQELTARIGEAPSAERAKLEALRTRLTDLTTLIDQQQMALVQNAVRVLQMIINAPNPEALIRENFGLIDDTFMAVLQANIQEAERRGDLNASSRLKQVYQQVVNTLQEQMQPELRFVNQLLSTDTDEEARTLVAAHARDYGDDLLNVIDAVGQTLAQHGEMELIQKLAFLRQAVAQELS